MPYLELLRLAKEDIDDVYGEGSRGFDIMTFKLLQAGTVADKSCVFRLDASNKPSA